MDNEPLNPDPAAIDITDGRFFNGGVRVVEAPTGALLGYEAFVHLAGHCLHLGIRDTPEEAAKLGDRVEALLVGAYLD